jgi:hypothetical protein
MPWASAEVFALVGVRLHLEASAGTDRSAVPSRRRQSGYLDSVASWKASGQSASPRPRQMKADRVCAAHRRRRRRAWTRAHFGSPGRPGAAFAGCAQARLPISHEWKSDRCTTVRAQGPPDTHEPAPADYRVRWRDGAVQPGRNVAPGTEHRPYAVAFLETEARNGL